MHIEQLENVVEDLRKALVRWEDVFKRTYDREVTLQDLGARPKIENVYREYMDFCRQLQRAREAARPRSTRVLFPVEKKLPVVPEREYTEEEAFWLDIEYPVKSSEKQKAEDEVAVGGRHKEPRVEEEKEEGEEVEEKEKDDDKKEEEEREEKKFIEEKRGKRDEKEEEKTKRKRKRRVIGM